MPDEYNAEKFHELVKDVERVKSFIEVGKIMFTALGAVTVTVILVVVTHSFDNSNKIAVVDDRVTKSEVDLARLSDEQRKMAVDLSQAKQGDAHDVYTDQEILRINTKIDTLAQGTLEWRARIAGEVDEVNRHLEEIKNKPVDGVR